MISTAIITAATVLAMLDSSRLMKLVALIAGRAPRVTAAGSSRNPASATTGSTIHSTSITFERAKPISSSRTSKRVGLGDMAASVLDRRRHRRRARQVAREQLVELGLDQADPAQPAAACERALDRRMDRGVGVGAVRKPDTPHTRLALARGAELVDERRVGRRGRPRELDLERPAE